MGAFRSSRPTARPLLVPARNLFLPLTAPAPQSITTLDIKSRLGFSTGYMGGFVYIGRKNVEGGCREGAGAVRMGAVRASVLERHTFL